MIGAVAVAYYPFKANAALAFWIVYILTRPLGAFFGDYPSQPIANGGLGLGSIVTGKSRCEAFEFGAIRAARRRAGRLGYRGEHEPRLLADGLIWIVLAGLIIGAVLVALISAWLIQGKEYRSTTPLMFLLLPLCQRIFSGLIRRGWMTR